VATMKRNLKLLATVLLLACAGLTTTTTGVSGDSHFVPPDITAATDIPYPIDNIASGLVSISINLTAAGQLQSVQIVRDIPGLTSAVTNAVNSWTFTPGKLDGKAVPSTINVQVIFNGGAVGSQNLPVQPGSLVTPPNPPGYFPPEISAVSFAGYPPNSLATGAVVLDLSIDKYSEVKKPTPIRPVASLTSAAIAALKTWTVNPATFNGKKLDAKLVVAFVFRSPNISTP
jgi:hypothetical protein